MAVINAEIPELEAFLAVAETGGFREAADRLDVSQPAVSNRIKRLEAKVGLRLLDRTTRRVELTEAGARFVEKAAVAVRGMSGLIDEFREEAATKHGRIKVAVAASLAAVVLPLVLVEYRRRYPQVRIELRETLDSGLEALKSGDADFAFVSDVIDRPGIRFEHLLTEQFVLLVRRGHPIERLPAITLSDIARYPMMLLANSPLGAAVADSMTLKGLSFDVALESHNVLTLLAMVEAGVGLIVLPRLLMARVDLNLVAARDIVDGPPPRRFGLAFRRGRTLSVAARALVRMIHIAGPVTAAS